MKKHILWLFAYTLSITSNAQFIDKTLLMSSTLKENKVKYIHKTDIKLSPEGEILNSESYSHFYTILDNGQLEFEKDSLFSGEETYFRVFHFNENCSTLKKVEKFDIDRENGNALIPNSEEEYTYLPNCELQKVIKNFFENDSYSASFEYNYKNGLETETVFKTNNKLSSRYTQNYINDQEIESRIFDKNNELYSYAKQKLTYHKDWEIYWYYSEQEVRYAYTAKTIYFNNQLLERYEYDEENQCYKAFFNMYLNNGLLAKSEETIFNEALNKIVTEKIIKYTYYGDNKKEIVPNHFIQPSLPKNELLFLKSYNNKYPNNTNLFENKPFTTRLEKLMGNRYQELYSKWMLETPIEVNNELVVAQASELHMPGIVDFIIIFDLKQNVLYAGMKNHSTYELFSENGQVHSLLYEFMK